MPAQKHATESFTAGRLSKSMCDLVWEYNEKLRLAWEVKNLSSVLKVDCAHVVMLAEQGYVSSRQASDILRELDDIALAGPEGFSIMRGYGSVALQIERILSERIGEDTAGHLPIARSRLDHGATVRRLSDRDSILRTTEQVLTLQRALIKTARKHGDGAFISYTHLQQAQPATFGHYLLAFSERLQDCFEQLTQVYDRMDCSPLGAVGLSGTDLHIDRHRTASLLGFSKLVDNSRLGRDSYYQLDATFALTMVMVVLNDLCTDLHIYTSVEFGTVELDDSQCSTSSVFPQKKNPYALETVKGKAGEAFGWTNAALAIFRNEGTGDTAMRSVGFLGDACKSTNAMLQLTAEIIEGLTVKVARCEELLSNSWVTTNRLGNILLTQHGLSYRAAHSVVGRLVKNCIGTSVPKASVTVDMLQQAATEMGVESIAINQADLTSALDHTAFLQSCISHGSVGPKQFERLLVVGTKQHNTNQCWVEDKVVFLQKSGRELEKAKEDIIDSAVE